MCNWNLKTFPVHLIETAINGSKRPAMANCGSTLLSICFRYIASLWTCPYRHPTRRNIATLPRRSCWSCCFDPWVEIAANWIFVKSLWTPTIFVALQSDHIQKILKNFFENLHHSKSLHSTDSVKKMACPLSLDHRWLQKPLHATLELWALCQKLPAWPEWSKSWLVLAIIKGPERIIFAKGLATGIKEVDLKFCLLAHGIISYHIYI